MTDSTPRPSRKPAFICGIALGLAAPIVLAYFPDFRMKWVHLGLLAAVLCPIPFFRKTWGSYLKGLLAGVLIDVVGVSLFLAVAGFPRMG